MSGNRYEVLKRIIEEDVHNPREYDGSIDEELGTIVMTCLAREPKNRYSSIAALSEDIGRYLNKQPLAAGVIGSSRVCLTSMNPLYMAGGWDNYDARPSSTLQVDNAYVLYYTSAGDTGRFSGKPCLGGIGRAVSRDGIVWPSQPGPDRQMVLEAGEPGNWDRYVGEPSVVYRSRGTSMYWMFFRAGNEPGWTRGKGSIGFASSPDGIYWDNRTCLVNEAEWSELSNRIEGIIALANPHYFHDPRSEKEYLYFSYTYYDDAVEGPLTNIGRVVLGP